MSQALGDPQEPTQLLSASRWWRGLLPCHFSASRHEGGLPVPVPHQLEGPVPVLSRRWGHKCTHQGPLPSLPRDRPRGPPGPRGRPSGQCPRTGGLLLGFRGPVTATVGRAHAGRSEGLHSTPHGPDPENCQRGPEARGGRGARGQAAHVPRRTDGRRCLQTPVLTARVTHRSPQPRGLPKLSRQDASDAGVRASLPPRPASRLEDPHAHPCAPLPSSRGQFATLSCNEERDGAPCGGDPHDTGLFN